VFTSIGIPLDGTGGAGLGGMGAEWTEEGGTSKEGPTEKGWSAWGLLLLTGAWIGRPHWSTMLDRSSGQLRTKSPDRCLWVIQRA